MPHMMKSKPSDFDLLEIEDFPYQPFRRLLGYPTRAMRID